jgi:hypothetical protein
MSGMLLALVAAVLSSGALSVGDGADAGLDRTEIKQAALDYAEGFYEGSAERVARAVHPALLKRGLLPPGAPDRFLQLMNAETLIDSTASEGGDLPAADRHLDFALLDLRGDVASARIFTKRFNDYLLLAKQEGRWRIVSVLWQVPASVGSEQDKAAVKKAIGEFFEGLYACDTARVRASVHPELIRRTLRPGARGTLVLDDSNVDRLLGSLLLTPAEKSYVVEVLDVHDRIASARVTQESQGSFIHLAKQDGRWRLVNMLSR